MTMSAPGLQQAGALQRQQAEQRRGGVAARIRQQARRLDRVELELGQSIGDAVRQRRRRRIELRARRRRRADGMRPTDRSRAGRSRAASARARRTRLPAARETRHRPRRPRRSAAPRCRPRSSRATGSRRGVLVACEPVAAVIVTWGWRASRRISSWPAKPVAPATATRIELLRAPLVPFRFGHNLRVHRSVSRSSMARRKTMRPEEYLYMHTFPRVNRKSHVSHAFCCILIHSNV